MQSINNAVNFCGQNVGYACDSIRKVVFLLNFVSKPKEVTTMRKERGVLRWRVK